MRYKAVLFDMDGTLLNTLEDLQSATNRALREFSMPERTLDEVRCYVGNGSQRLIEQAVPEGTSPEKVQEVLSWYKQYYYSHRLVKTVPYPGVIQLIEKLREKDVPMAIVSNKPDSAVRELGEYFFPGSMKFTIGQQDGLGRKPSPDMLELAMEKMGVERHECVYVGDSEVDVLTSINAGMDCVAVGWGFRSVEELVKAGATRIVYSADELYEALT